MNSPSSDEASELEEVQLFQSKIDAKPEIDVYHEPLCFNDEDVVNGEDVEQTSAVEESQMFPDVDSSFENGNNIEAIDFFLKEKSMFVKPGTIFQECGKNLAISEEGNIQLKNLETGA
ncbi:hypothetical protein Avbf_02716 [Armadillidium vulgare]|nr:hypothetical protein Avbf_02716 [Armadillidium vulgare]